LRTPHFKSELSPNEIWKQSPLDPKAFKEIHSVFRTKENDPKQRMWFVMDHSLMLPEYLVDFEY